MTDEAKRWAACLDRARSVFGDNSDRYWDVRLKLSDMPRKGFTWPQVIELHESSKFDPDSVDYEDLWIQVLPPEVLCEEIHGS